MMTLNAQMMSVTECRQENEGRNIGGFFCLHFSAYLRVSQWVLIFAAVAEISAVEFRVGFAQADITPPVGWRRAGNYTELISTGVNDPLMTKAMVVQDGVTTFAFVGNDLCSVPRDLTDLARRVL